MALYHYKALNTRGEMLDGQMEAASHAEVAARLQDRRSQPMFATTLGEVWVDDRLRVQTKRRA